MNIFELGEKNPNYLGAVDLLDCENRETELTIDRIYEAEIESERGNQRCTICAFKENVRPMVLNTTNKKLLCRILKTAETDKMLGKRIVIGTEPVKAFGKVVQGLRLRRAGSASVACSACGKPVLPFGERSAAEIAAYTEQKYGSALCAACAAAQKAKADREVSV